MDRNRDTLLEAARKGSSAPPEEAVETRALIRAAGADAQVTRNLESLERFLPVVRDSELTDFSKCALLGVCVGFAERHLSPYVEEHLTIIPPLLEDIISVYEQLKEMGASIDREDFRFRAYDYGIHKAYYLDWRLYLSKDMY